MKRLSFVDTTATLSIQTKKLLPKGHYRLRYLHFAYYGTQTGGHAFQFWLDAKSSANPTSQFICPIDKGYGVAAAPTNVFTRTAIHFPMNIEVSGEEVWVNGFHDNNVYGMQLCLEYEELSGR